MSETESLKMDLRKRAARLLKVGDGADVVSLLKYADDSHYILPAASIDAMQILVNSTADPGLVRDARDAAREDQLGAAVRGFAASYFILRPDEREKQWRTLVRECSKSPGLRRWLQELHPALQLETIPAMNDEDFNRFVQMCCEAFLARGFERARRRQEIVRLYCSDQETWRPVLGQLRFAHASFENAVAPWFDRLPATIQQEQYRYLPILQTPKESSNGSRATWPLFLAPWPIAWILIIVVVRLVASAGREAQRSPAIAPPPIKRGPALPGTSLPDPSSPLELSPDPQPTSEP